MFSWHFQHLTAIVVVSILGQTGERDSRSCRCFYPGFTRIVLASVLEEREKDYVKAAQIFGTSDMKLCSLKFTKLHGPTNNSNHSWFSDGILMPPLILGLGQPYCGMGNYLSDLALY